MIIFKVDMPEAGLAIILGFEFGVLTLVNGGDHKLLAWKTAKNCQDLSSLNILYDHRAGVQQVSIPVAFLSPAQGLFIWPALLPKHLFFRCTCLLQYLMLL